MTTDPIPRYRCTLPADATNTARDRIRRQEILDEHRRRRRRMHNAIRATRIDNDRIRSAGGRP